MKNAKAQLPVLGIGCDLVQVDRITRMVRRSPELFAQRILGAVERTLNFPESGYRRYALHIAAKEAAFKALGTGLVGDMRWSDVQLLPVQNARTTQAQLLMTGAALRQMQAIGAKTIAVTLSASAQYALACVVLT
jgi:holo-[acyl-carrier protein] synthase